MSADAKPRLERSLNLRDLVLFNLVAVIGITWVATAAKAGPSSLTLWLLAALLFFMPQGLAAIQLSTSYPDEGGIYAWTKREFREGHGFLKAGSTPGRSENFAKATASCAAGPPAGRRAVVVDGRPPRRSCSPLDGSAGLFLLLLGLVFHWRAKETS